MSRGPEDIYSDARAAGIALIELGIACWPGPPLFGALVTLCFAPRFCRWFDWRFAVGCGRPSRGPDRVFDRKCCACANESEDDARPSQNKREKTSRVSAVEKRTVWVRTVWGNGSIRRRLAYPRAGEAPATATSTHHNPRNWGSNEGSTQ